MAKWKEAQAWEASWWGSCVNTYGEQEKQLAYARRMGLEFFHDGRSPYNINLAGKSVIDIGGGPESLLLKCVNRGERCMVVDPLGIPEWITMRYELAGIRHVRKPGEQLAKVEGISLGYDEAWIYNCLQHTANPKLIIENALKFAKIVRLFEWINTRINEGHPHSFTYDQLDNWLGGIGKVEQLRGEANCYGWCYYGIFVGR